ncbi:hypothetical protein BCR42DRAFT_447826 [Absidia repens]|uniref:Uncharacterized protein n=1 Tax=Absidia repens TaxID=90262 RepID=A0A1X2IUV8_9FUNG|nr:hypothetical protein BCR42DRAFT_447826 [Absidia repens]
MNIADFVYSDSSSPLANGHIKASISPSSTYSRQKLTRPEQVQDLRRMAFNELQQSIQSYNDSFVMSMRYQEKQERLNKQQQLGQSSTSGVPARHGIGHNVVYMDDGDWCLTRGDNSRNPPYSGTRFKGQRNDWKGNNSVEHIHPSYGYDYSDDNLEGQSTIGSPRVPSKDSRMMNELVAILQTGTINDYAPVLEWESKQMPCGDLWM